MLAMVIWSAIALINIDRALLAAIVVLPLGMLAAVKLPIGGFTPPIAQLYLAGALALAATARITSHDRSGGWLVPHAAIPLLLYAIWGIFSAIVLVRLFAGDVMVFSMDRGTQGARISPMFKAGLSRLSPVSSNISQTAYMLLSVGFFIALADLTRRLGLAPMVRALRTAAIINIVLGVLDAAALDILLEPLRTADYALHNEHRIAGIPRIIGGFAEASVFGSFSAAIGAFFVVRGFDRSDPRDLGIGLANLAFALVALSSTAFLGLAVFALCIVVRRLRRFSAKVQMTRAVATLAVIPLGILAAGVAAVVLFGAGEILSVLDKLVFNKAETTSGLERGAMAAQGLRIMADTYGIGVGIGSVRANGWFAATAAAVGLPGLALMLWFLLAAFVTWRPRVTPGLAADRAGAQIAGVVAGAIACASSFEAYPSLVLIVFAATATGTLMPETGLGRAPIRQTVPPAPALSRASVRG
ncbi:MAG: hypothetical protein AAF899_01775 [Pseudomonadota bacterium]